MLIVERQKKLLEILQSKQTAQLEFLAEALDVSLSTVRRDLENLEKEGVVERTHGGAIYRGEYRPRIEMGARMLENIEAKKKIGAYVARMIEPGMTVLMDGGSTVYYTAQMIKARPLQVVTNSLSIASLFSDDDRVELVVIGGNLYPRSEVMIGPIATRALNDLHADLALLSLAGLYENSVYNLNLAMAEVERVMLRQAAKSILLMDSSKFGHKSLSKVCDIEEMNLIVTDDAISEKWSKRLGDRLAVAG